MMGLNFPFPFSCLMARQKADEERVRDVHGHDILPGEKIRTPLSKSRLEALTDGVFAFAMTLLILGIDVPAKLPESTGDPVFGYLISILPSIIQFVIAFAVLAGFWVTHHLVFDRVRHVDRKMIWMNLLGLLFLVFIPFSTQIADDFGAYPSAAMVFEANILAVGVVFYAQWHHSCGMGESGVCPEDPAERRVAELRMLIMPAVSLAAIVVALVGATWSTALYVLIPVLYIAFTGK